MNCIVFIITCQVITNGLGQMKDVKRFCFQSVFKKSHLLKTKKMANFLLIKNKYFCFPGERLYKFLISCWAPCFVRLKYTNETGIISIFNYFLYFHLHMFVRVYFSKNVRGYVFFSLTTFMSISVQTFTFSIFDNNVWPICLDCSICVARKVTNVTNNCLLNYRNIFIPIWNCFSTVVMIDLQMQIFNIPWQDCVSIWLGVLNTLR